MLLAIVAYLFLALFAVSLIVTYVLARRDRFPVLIIGVIGVAGSALSLFAYKLMIGSAFGDALFFGFGLGFLFTLAVLSVGVFFSANTENESAELSE